MHVLYLNFILTIFCAVPCGTHTSSIIVQLASAADTCELSSAPVMVDCAVPSALWSQHMGSARGMSGGQEREREDGSGGRDNRHLHVCLFHP